MESWAESMELDDINSIEFMSDENGYSDEQIARLRSIVERSGLADCQIEDLAKFLELDSEQLYPRVE